MRVREKDREREKKRDTGWRTNSFVCMSRGMPVNYSYLLVSRHMSFDVPVYVSASHPVDRVLDCLFPMKALEATELHLNPFHTNILQSTTLHCTTLRYT